jgi:hypothetical protein
LERDGATAGISTIEMPTLAAAQQLQGLGADLNLDHRAARPPQVADSS